MSFIPRNQTEQETEQNINNRNSGKLKKSFKTFLLLIIFVTCILNLLNNFLKKIDEKYINHIFGNLLNKTDNV